MEPRATPSKLFVKTTIFVLLKVVIVAVTLLLGSNHGTPGETMQALYVCGRNIDSHFCRHLANFPLGNNLFIQYMYKIDRIDL